MISETLKKQIVDAMKAKDEVRISTLKLLSAALTNAEIAKRAKVGADPKAFKLTEGEELAVVQKEAKQRRDSIEAFRQAQGKLPGRSADIKERIEKEKKELEILQEYLPQELSEEKLTALIDEVISATGAENIKDMGRVIGQVMSKAKGGADGKKVAEMVKRKLS